MKTLKLLLCLFAIMFGIFIFVYGGMDDSPGAQLLGLVVFIIGVVSIFKNRKKNNNSN